MTDELPPRAKHKTRMVEAAVVVLEREGLQALQARRIARECGCSVGTIYNTFEGLDDLIVQANSLKLARLRQNLAESTKHLPGEAITDRLMALALTYLDFAVGNENAWRAIFEHRPQDQWVVPLWYREQQSELFTTVANVLAPMISDGATRERMARALFAAVHGIIGLSLDHGADRSEIAARVELVITATADHLHRMNGTAARI